MVQFEQMETTENTRLHSARNRAITVVFGVAAVALVILIGVRAPLRSQTIPDGIRSQVNYTVYYPAVLPGGYKLKADSAKINQATVSYELSRGGSTIFVSEQALPASPPDITNLTNFKQVSTLAGHAAIGNENGKPVAVLLSNTTLVSLIGTSDVPINVLTDVVTSLKSLPRP